MFFRAVQAVLALGLVVIAMLVMFPDISQNLEAARTDPESETGLSCTTGSTATSCTVTLATAHEYSDTSEMTVTETAPGSVNRTGDTTVGADRVTLTVANLGTSTAYTFDVNYAIRAANVDAGTNEFLSLFVPLLVLVIIGAILLAFLAPVIFSGRG